MIHLPGTRWTEWLQNTTLRYERDEGEKKKINQMIVRAIKRWKKSIDGRWCENYFGQRV